MNKIILLALIVLLLVYVLTTLSSNQPTSLEGFRSMPTTASVDATNPSLGLNYPNNDRDILHGGASHNANPGANFSATHEPVALLDRPPLAPPLPSTRPVNGTQPSGIKSNGTQSSGIKSNGTQPSVVQPTQPTTTQIQTQPSKIDNNVETKLQPKRNILNMDKALKYFTEPFKQNPSNGTNNANGSNGSNGSNAVNGRSEESEEEESCDIASKCSADTCGSSSLHPILDPRFNMRECAKQCLLLEDHMNNEKKRCFDCIRKHFLVVDGLLEEAISLEQDNQKRAQYRDLYIQWLTLEQKYSRDPLSPNNLDGVSKEIRIFRKPLVERYFDLVKDYEL